MSYSRKQKIFAEYMLKQIGICEKDIQTYLNILENSFGKWETYDNSSFYKGYDLRFSVRECISLLITEINIKKRRQFKRKQIDDKISATDLSNFDFCPISFAISKSFDIEFPTGKEFTEQGKQLHEDLKAIKRNWARENENQTINVNPELSTIKKSKVIFAGHKNKNKVFYNEYWKGIPDYILEDNLGNLYVVEEKFRYKRDPAKNNGFLGYEPGYGEIYDEYLEEVYREEEQKWKESKGYFFSNHLVQLISYIKKITEYDIKYGILIYWYYDFTNEVPYIHKVSTQKVTLNEKYEKLFNSTYSNIITLKQEKQMNIDPQKLNLNKCVNCVVSSYCGHKTKKFTNFEFPYNIKNSIIYQQEFPEELIKGKSRS